MRPGTPPPLRATRLLDQVRERVRYHHYSLSTERIYVLWIRTYIRFHRLRHPRDMGQPEVEGFLSYLANERRVSASTHKQALAALSFSTSVCWISSCHGCRRLGVRVRRNG